MSSENLVGVDRISAMARLGDVTEDVARGGTPK